MGELKKQQPPMTIDEQVENLKPKNGCYDKQTTFKEIVDLYLFNANFRQIIFPEIEKLRLM